jgi:hypothetical protein
MSVHTSAGTTIGIVAGAPATYNVAGYTALAFTTIGEITNAGEFGRVYQLITHNPLATRGTQKFKGSYNEGAINLNLALDTDDAGQVLAKVALDSDNDYSFKVAMPGGDDFYFRAKVMSFPIGVNDSNSLTTATMQLEITTSSAGVGIVEDLA